MGNLNFMPKTHKLLSKRYSEPQRHYHDLTHIEHCFRNFARFVHAIGPTDSTGLTETKGKLNAGLTAAQYNEIRLMVWFHDVIYNTDASYKLNEANSADFFADTYKLDGEKLKSGPEQVIYDGILYSANHLETHEGLTLTQQIFLDLDLSGMGGNYDEFIVNGDNIRKEFDWVPLAEFLTNRVKFFQELLKRENIYYHPKMRELFEANTRDNITRYIADVQEG